jgi:hypothetical protein
MSWDISLETPEGQALQVAHPGEGGTYALGGSNEADLNVTYNYSEVTRLVSFHFRDNLHGKQAAWTIRELERVVRLLGDRPYEKDYWAPTPGNAGLACAVLLSWAVQHPEGIWRVE